jgi:hypothetical protein
MKKSEVVVGDIRGIRGEPEGIYIKNTLRIFPWEDIRGLGLGDLSSHKFYINGEVEIPWCLR